MLQVMFIGSGVNELARYLDSPASSLHRILKTLREEGILQLVPETNKYTIGNEWARMSSVVNVKFGIKVVAEPALKRLSQEFNQSVYLAIYQEQHQKLSFILDIHSQNALQYRLELGVLQSIHIGDSGKAILSYLSDDTINSILEQEQVSPQERERIWDHIQEVREKGYSYTSSERKSESIGIGAPLFDATGKIAGSIICAIPFNLYKEELKESMIQRVVETAGEISYSLGYTANPR